MPLPQTLPANVPPGEAGGVRASLRFVPLCFIFRSSPESRWPVTFEPLAARPLLPELIGWVSRCSGVEQSQLSSPFFSDVLVLW